jgi:putative membrane protein
MLRQPFGLVSLRLETAGYRNEPAAAQTLFPLLRRRDLEDVLARLVPELAGALGPVSGPPRRALAAYVLPGALAALFAVALCVWQLPALWPVAAVVALLAAAHGVARHGAAGWRMEDGRVLLRRRRFARRTMIALVARLQEHTLAQTPLQRRRRLAGLALAVGSGRRTGVAHLDVAVAERLFAELTERSRAGVRRSPRAAAPSGAPTQAATPTAPMNAA